MNMRYIALNSCGRLPIPKSLFMVPVMGLMTATGTAGIAEGSEATGRNPNIVYILADDMGYGDCGCNNHESKIPTPYIDKLATEGIRLTNEHAPSAVCSPSRYCILTGRYAWRSPLQMGVLASLSESIITPGRMTVASLLSANGYSTLAIGKWHLGLDWPTTDGKRPWITTNPNSRDNLSNIDFRKPIGNGPTSRGFDHYFGTNIPNMPPYCFIEDDHTVGIPSAPAGLEIKSLYHTSRLGPMTPGWQLVNIMPELVRHAVSYIDAAGKASRPSPFFIYLALISPHGPIVPMPQFRGKSGAGDYGDYVIETDWAVGQVMDALKKANLADNTLLIFTSDNGPEITCGEVPIGAYDRVARYHHYSMGNWRGTKRDTWEGGHRLPFVARWPGKIRAGSVSDELVSHSDLLATVAAIVGAPLPDNAGEDSCNILPLLLGQPHEEPIRKTLVLNSGWNHFAIREGDWMLIDAPTGDSDAIMKIGPRGKDGEYGEPDWFKKERGYTADNESGELFNLKQDPAEHYNLYASEPERVKVMKALLEKYKKEGRSTPGVPEKNDVPIRPYKYAYPYVVADE